MKTLEEIIKHQYGIKRVFRKSDGEFTKAGARAYKQLVEFLYDIGNIAVHDVNDIVETLDYITRAKY